MMRTYCWIPWLLAVFICLPSSEARYKLRRPLPPPPPPSQQIFKKAWPISHRVSMGNTIHINNNNIPHSPHKRPPVFLKPNNFRMRRPPIMFNAPPTNWKNQIPIIGAIPNLAVLPQRAPFKEFNVINKALEYSPAYKPSPLAFPPTHRGGIDDDKGPIHTIPAPNLSIADKPYIPTENSRVEVHQEDYRRYPVNVEYSSSNQPTIEPQRPVTSSTPTQSTYEVTESSENGIREYQTDAPTYYQQEFESSRIPSGPNTDLQSNEVYLNHPSMPPVSRSGVIGTNIQFGQSNIPMQTNLHSSLHVGFPSTAAQAPTLNSQIPELHVQAPEIHIGQQIPDLHVGHPAIAGPPMSATQLYDLLNSFPQPLGDQYSTGQQPQLQQHILQQQLGQLFQPEASPTTFSQPQMHSFNYDEQANKQQQQQVLVEQDYGAGRVTADYNLQPEQTEDTQKIQNIQNPGAIKQNDDFGYQLESVEQPENNIEFEEATSNDQENRNYFGNMEGEASIPNQYYTTLPNREAAEKLAALAAAGSVNSHLIQQLQKAREREQQQQQQQQEQEQQEQYEDDQQNDEPMPTNHRGNYQVSEQVDDVPDEQNNQRQRPKLRISAQKRYRQHQRQQQIQREQEEADKHYERHELQQQKQQQQTEGTDNDKRPLRIMVPDVDENPSSSQTSNSNSNPDYDYESIEPVSSDTKITGSTEENYENISSDFGSRIRSKPRE